MKNFVNFLNYQRTDGGMIIRGATEAGAGVLSTPVVYVRDEYEPTCSTQIHTSST
jgi:hypothetical protein